jgi:ribonuclease-3
LSERTNVKDRRGAAVEALQERLGYTFSDPALLDTALTHASAGEGARTVRHNERLEFLGDRVLNLLTAEQLIARYPDQREGELSKRIHNLISRDACARVARRIGLGDALKLAGGESRHGGRDHDTILGDACEALLAALYRDCGLDRTREIYLQLWQEEFEQVDERGPANPKSELQELAAARKLKPPRYEVLDRSGPDHAPTFTVELSVEGLAPERARGRSRQEAEKAAAIAMLARERPTS